MQLSITAVTTVAFALFAQLAFADESTPQDLTPQEYVGCYLNSGTLVFNGTNIYQSSGICHETCFAKGTWVFGMTKKNQCWCGNKIPWGGKVDKEKNCVLGCQGFDKETCGGASAFDIYLTGIQGAGAVPVAKEGDAQDVISSASTGLPTATTTQGGKTVVVTAPPATSTVSTPGGKTNVAAIAAGVVVALVAVAAIGIGAFLFMRKKKKQEGEKTYRKSMGANMFNNRAVHNGPDHRIDPVMLQQRRQSNGSIADEQDYSKRILKVTNPDGY